MTRDPNPVGRAGSEPVRESDDEADDGLVEWLDGDPADDGADEGLDGVEHVGLGAAILPSPTTTRRLAATALVFGLALGATGLAAASAYRHDRSVAALSGTLIMQQASATRVEPQGLNVSSGTWQVAPSYPFVFLLTNLSPDPVTLLPGGSIDGPGVVAVGLRSEQPGPLAPGATARLDGTLTVNCAFSGRSDDPLFPATYATIPARTTDGAVRRQTVLLGTEDETLRQRICQTQTPSVFSTSTTQAYDPAQRTVTVTLQATSRADVPVHYQFDLADYSHYSLRLQGGPEAVSATGTVGPGGRLTESYVFTVPQCPAAPLAADSADFQAELTPSIAGEDLGVTRFTPSLAAATNAVCGFGHNSA